MGLPSVLLARWRTGCLANPDGAGVDTGELGEDEVANLFGKTKGFKASEPHIETEEEDF